MESVAYVGMDVDKEKIAVALVQDYEDQPRMQRIVRNRAEAIEKFFGEVTGRYDQVLACYEAGACGFELHRRVTAAGAGCIVAAPASMPKKAKQRLLHFLLRHEIRYEGGQNWTGKHWQWLRSLKFDSAIAGATFEEYLAEVSHLEEKRRRVATRVEALGGDDRYKEAVSRLRAFKGIGALTALAFILEIGDFRRFAWAEQFMAFLGLVPSEHSSGEKRRLGNITKAGNSHLRKLLVEAAWVSRRYGAPSKRLIRDRSEVPAHIAGYVGWLTG
ncbi:MAG: transposase [Spirochaetia bacterium]